MQIVETPVYFLEELSPEARDHARGWYREGGFDYEWYEYIFEDFERICEILGITLKTRSVKLYGGGTRQAPLIWFTGFWSQGDGASFEGTYSYAKGAAAKIRAYAPQEAKLQEIAKTLQEIQRRNFYQIYADINQHGYYYHENTIHIMAERDHPEYPDHPCLSNDDEEGILEAFRDLARWLYAQLREEYEYLNSDETVDEAIIANDYTFTAEGKRFG